MKKISSRSHSRHQKSGSVNFDKELHVSKSFQIKNLDLSSLSLNIFSSNNPNNSDFGSEPPSQKQSKVQSPAINYENLYFKLCCEIRETFLGMKNRIIHDDPNCVIMLKKQIPFEQADEVIATADAITIVQYINKIHNKIFELKKEADAEIIAKKEAECTDYEVMLQKLEAEVRQHIRIEQQLKLYAESTQAKLDDFEKNYDPAKIEVLKKENEDLKRDYGIITEKLKKRDSEIEHYKREVQAKNNLVKDFEHQIENISFLKNRIKELEKFISQNGIKLPNPNVLKSSNKNSKDNENLDKNSSFSNQQQTSENKSRKGSQNNIGFQSGELSKHKHERDKENIETYKLDLSKYMYETSKGNRSNSRGESYKNGDHSRYDISMNKSTTKKDERSDDFGSVLEKMKKSLRSSHSRNASRDNRSFDQTLYQEDNLDNDLKISEHKKNKKDTADFAKSNYDKRFSSGSYNKEMGRKSWDKSDYKLEAKPAHNKTSKEMLDDHNTKNNIPKPSRTSTGNENSYLDFSKNRKEYDIYDLNKLKIVSPKKSLQDRSQSVDAKQKLHKQLKSREEPHNKENSRPSIGSSHISTNSYTITRNMIKQ